LAGVKGEEAFWIKKKEWRVPPIAEKGERGWGENKNVSNWRKGRGGSGCG